MKKWYVKGYEVGSCIVWVAAEDDSNAEVGFFLISVDCRPAICVMSETKSGAIAAAQGVWRTQTSYIGQTY